MNWWIIPLQSIAIHCNLLQFLASQQLSEAHFEWHHLFFAVQSPTRKYRSWRYSIRRLTCDPWCFDCSSYQSARWFDSHDGLSIEIPSIWLLDRDWILRKIKIYTQNTLTHRLEISKWHDWIRRASPGVANDQHFQWFWQYNYHSIPCSAPLNLSDRNYLHYLKSKQWFEKKNKQNNFEMTIWNIQLSLERTMKVWIVFLNEHPPITIKHGHRTVSPALTL